MTTEYFKNNICKYCKANCDKAIVIENNANISIMQCISYEKDENKIHGYKKPLKRTAKLQKTLMGLAGCDWS